MSEPTPTPTPQPYRPTGLDLDWFTATLCLGCKRNRSARPCSIRSRMLTYKIDATEYPHEIQKVGNVPQCTAYASRIDVQKRRARMAALRQGRDS